MPNFSTIFSFIPYFFFNIKDKSFIKNIAVRLFSEYVINHLEMRKDSVSQLIEFIQSNLFTGFSVKGHLICDNQYNLEKFVP